jgi:hypothetical protein
MAPVRTPWLQVRVFLRVSDSTLLFVLSLPAFNYYFLFVFEVSMGSCLRNGFARASNCPDPLLSLTVWMLVMGGETPRPLCPAGGFL